MGRPRKEVTQPDRPPQEGGQPGAPTSKVEARTLTIRFGDDSKPLPLSEENRERLRAATPDLLGELPEEVGPPPSIALEKLARHTVNATNLAQIHLGSRLTSLSLPEARRALKYTQEEQKEITEALIPVLDKRLGPWLKAHPDEYGLALILAAISTECWARAKEAVEKTKQEGRSDEHSNQFAARQQR